VRFPRLPRSPSRPARRLLVAAAAAAGLFSSPALANERHFTYTYETAVLPTGAKELEIWTTPRIGRDDYFVRFDERMEFEWGLTDRLMSALYLNFSNTTADVAPEMRETEFEFEGVSSEWKYKISDPVADTLGLGVYGEVTGSTNELELEGKILLDKRIGSMLLAGNLVLEQEWEFEPEETESEQAVEIDLAGTFMVRPGLSAGLEVRNVNAIHEGELEHSALFAGPVLAYATDTWWIALTLLPQLPALKAGDANDGSRVLSDHEKLEARLLLSFHL
jgi:hypothetical protein